jgi:hypothetical protein
MSIHPDIENSIAKERIAEFHEHADRLRRAPAQGGFSPVFTALSALSSLLIKTGEQMKAYCVELEHAAGNDVRGQTGRVRRIAS